MPPWNESTNKRQNKAEKRKKPEKRENETGKNGMTQRKMYCILAKDRCILT